MANPPSPNPQYQEVTVLVTGVAETVEVSVKNTVSGASPFGGEAEKLAVGGVLIVIHRTRVRVLAQPQVSVTVRVTVY